MATSTAAAAAAAATSSKSQFSQRRRPRPINEAERLAIDPFLDKLIYSPRYKTTPSNRIDVYSRYADDENEYRWGFFVLNILIQ